VYPGETAPGHGYMVIDSLKPAATNSGHSNSSTIPAVDCNTRDFSRIFNVCDDAGHSNLMFENMGEMMRNFKLRLLRSY
jgi:hypothetical protein